MYHRMIYDAYIGYMNNRLHLPYRKVRSVLSIEEQLHIQSGIIVENYVGLLNSGFCSTRRRKALLRNSKTVVCPIKICLPRGRLM